MTVKDLKQNWCYTRCHETTRHMSSIQNGERHVGHGHRQLSQISGCIWSCRLANHLPMHSRHHIGRHWQLRHADVVSVSSAHRRLSLMHATVCMQPTHWSSSYIHRHPSLKTAFSACHTPTLAYTPWGSSIKSICIILAKIYSSPCPHCASPTHSRHPQKQLKIRLTPQHVTTVVNY